MRIILLSILLIAMVHVASAQSTERDSSSLFVLTCDANQQWLDTLKAKPLDQQLSMIRYRAIADTNIVITANEKLVFIPDRQTGCCKPQFYLNGNYITFDYRHPGPELNRFLTVLSQIKVDSVMIFKTGEQLNIHGNYAKCGIVYISVKDKPSKRLIRQAYKNPL